MSRLVALRSLDRSSSLPDVTEEESVTAKKTLGDARRRVFVVGATGGVGRRLVALLAHQGHAVTGMHRSADQAAALRGVGASPVQGDLTADQVETLASRMAGHDAVVFAAGAGGGGEQLTTAIDEEGAIKTVDAAVAAGVRRFVLVSVFMDASRGTDSPGAGFEHYMSAKRAADAHLAATDLDFLLVRPGTLTDSPGRGRLTAGIAVPYGEVPRDDVAAFVAAALFAPGLDRTAVEVTTGKVAVDEAVARLRQGLTREP